MDNDKIYSLGGKILRNEFCTHWRWLGRGRRRARKRCWGRLGSVLRLSKHGLESRELRDPNFQRANTTADRASTRSTQVQVACDIGPEKIKSVCDHIGHVVAIHKRDNCKYKKLAY